MQHREDKIFRPSGEAHLDEEPKQKSEQVDRVKPGEAGHKKLVDIAERLKIVLVAVEEDKAGENEEECDAEVAVLQENGDRARHMRPRGEGGSEVKGHDVKRREKTKSRKRMQAPALDALSGCGNQTFIQ